MPNDAKEGAGEGVDVGVNFKKKLSQKNPYLAYNK